MAIEKRKFLEVIGSLEYEELVELQRDLLSGSTGIKNVVSSKLKEIATKESRTCAMCGSAVNLRVANEFTLIFGPPDAKKRAFFCALDCMQYFTNSLKRVSAKSISNNSNH